MIDALSTAVLLSNKDLGFGLRLADHHCCWCAWCFDYITRRSDLERHHIWPKGALIALLGKNNFPTDCLVPVHKQGCHREGFQKCSDIAGTVFSELGSLDSSETDETCHAAFFEGNLTRAVFVREWASRHYDELLTPDERHHNLIHQLNALAGSALANPLTGRGRGLSKISWLEDRIRGEDISSELLTYAGSVLVNSGHIDEGWKFYQQVSSAVPRWRRNSNELNGVIKRRLAAATCELKHSIEAVKLAEHQQYTLRTALLSLAWSRVRCGEYTKALDTFEDITSLVPGPISWLHRAGQDFGRGCATYLQGGSERLERSLGMLFRAQYIYALLGLQGTPIPDPRIEARSAPELVTPTDVVIWLGEKHAQRLPRGLLTDIRKREVGPLRKPLMDTLKRPNYERLQRT